MMNMILIQITKIDRKMIKTMTRCLILTNLTLIEMAEDLPKTKMSLERIKVAVVLRYNHGTIEKASK